MSMIQAREALKDTFSDIINKAQLGLTLRNEVLIERAEITMDDLERAKGGSLDLAVLEKLAFVLNLHFPSLRAIAKKEWQPEPQAPIDGLMRFTTLYQDTPTHAYLVFDPESRRAASFDTGMTCKPILDAVEIHGLKLTRVFITHTHPEHQADLDTLLALPQVIGYGSMSENSRKLSALRDGDGLTLGRLRIRVLGTSGHTAGGLSYFITGLEKPIVLSGDALMAGTMGKSPFAYAFAEALQTNREKLLTLPDETVLCPGHGPQTTVGEEKAHNPFYPEFKPDYLSD